MPPALYGHLREDARPLLGLQVGHQVGGVVVGQLAQELCAPVRGHRREQVRRVLVFLHLGERFGGQLCGKSAQDHKAVGVRERLQDIRHIRGMELRQRVVRLRDLPLGDRGQQNFLAERERLLRRHGGWSGS